MLLYVGRFFFFFKQKTAYEIYQCDWSSDVCSSDLICSRRLTRSSRTQASCTRSSSSPSSALSSRPARRRRRDFWTRLQSMAGGSGGECGKLIGASTHLLFWGICDLPTSLRTRPGTDKQHEGSSRWSPDPGSVTGLQLDHSCPVVPAVDRRCTRSAASSGNGRVIRLLYGVEMAASDRPHSGSLLKLILTCKLLPYNHLRNPARAGYMHRRQSITDRSCAVRSSSTARP